MSEATAIEATPQEIENALAIVRAALPEIGMFSQTPLPDLADADKLQGDEDAIDNLMHKWVNDAYDVNWIIDQLTPQEQTDFYFTVIPCWLDLATLQKLLHAVDAYVGGAYPDTQAAAEAEAGRTEHPSRRTYRHSADEQLNGDGRDVPGGV
jgi:hypothetical protein